MTMNKDRRIALIAAAIAILVITLSLRLPPSPIPDDPGSHIFPIFAACFMLISATALFLQKTDKEKEKEASGKPFFNKEERKRFVMIFVTYLLYFVLLWAAGFIPASLVTLFIASYLFLDKDKKFVVWKHIVIAVVVTSVVYICFLKLLGFRLPVGQFIRLDL